MKQEEVKIRKILENDIRVFNEVVVTSVCSDFQESVDMNFDEWQEKQATQRKDELVFLMQCSNNNIRKLVEHIKFEHYCIEANRINTIKEAGQKIKDDLLKYIINFPVTVNIELWVHEYVRAISVLNKQIEDTQGEKEYKLT